jgi:hypothetical protein
MARPREPVLGTGAACGDTSTGHNAQASVPIMLNVANAACAAKAA